MKRFFQITLLIMIIAFTFLQCSDSINIKMNGVIKDLSEVWKLSGHTGPIHQVAFSPDGKYVASLSYDLALKVWNFETGELFRTITADEKVIYSMAFSPDGKYIATVEMGLGGFSQITFWDIETGEKAKNISTYGKLITNLVFSPNGKYLVTTGLEAISEISEQICFWNTETGMEIRSITTKSGFNPMFGFNFNTQIAFSPDGKYLVYFEGNVKQDEVFNIPSMEQTIKIVEVETDKEYKSFPSSFSNNPSISFLEDGRKLLIGGNSQGFGKNKIIELNIDTGKETELNIDSSTGFISKINISPKGKYFLAKSFDMEKKTSKLILCDIKTGKELYPINIDNYDDFFDTLKFSPDEKHIALASNGTKISIFETMTGNKVKIVGENGIVTHITTSKNGKYIISSEVITRNKSNIIIREAATGKVIKIVETESIINSIASSPDGQFIATCQSGQDKQMVIAIRNIKSGEVVNTITREDAQSFIYSLGYSPDGKYIVFCSTKYPTMPGQIIQCDAKTGEEIKSISCDGIPIALSYSPDGKYLASSEGIFNFSNMPNLNINGKINIWDMETGELVRSLEGFGLPITIAYSPDGKYLVSTNNDIKLTPNSFMVSGNIIIWDAKTGEVFKQIEEGGIQLSAAFSSDGQYIASGSLSNSVKIWETKTGSCVKSITGTFAYTRFISFSSDGKYLLTNSGGHPLSVWAIKYN